MTDPSITHGAVDTLPRVSTSARQPDLRDVHVPFRITSDPARPMDITAWHLDVTVGGRPWPGVRTRRVTRDYVAMLRRR